MPPSGTPHTILWTSRAEGEVGMDDAPGLRHAINGTGETSQTFAYGDIAGEVSKHAIMSMGDAHSIGSE